jgi:rubrerythrin
MRKLAYALTAAILAAGVPTMSGHELQPVQAQAQKPDAKKVQELMRKKLENAQKILEALALNDVDKASKHAEELLKIRKEVNFRVFQTEQYEMWSNEFSRNAEGIIKAAKDKNPEAAKLQYLGMTLCCFHCHTYVRDMKSASAETDAGQ